MGNYLSSTESIIRKSLMKRHLIAAFMMVVLVASPVYTIPLKHTLSTNSENISKCSSCTSDNVGTFASFNRLIKLGDQLPAPFIQVYHPNQNRPVVGNVNTYSGEVTFSISDLHFSETNPLAFIRTYTSRSRNDSGLGQGWSIGYDDRIIVEGNRAILENGLGQSFKFHQKLNTSQYILENYQAGERWFEISGNTIKESDKDIRRYYVKRGQTYRLSKVAFSYGGTISINFDKQENIRSIKTDKEAAIYLHWSEDPKPTLVAVSDNLGRRIHFIRDKNLLLQSKDPANNTWLYAYVNSRLVKVKDSQGRDLLRVSYDLDGRAVESAILTSTYHYKYQSDNFGSTQAATIMNNGEKAHLEYDRNGNLTKITDPVKSIAVVYDDLSRLQSIRGSNGSHVVFKYGQDVNRISEIELKKQGESIRLTYDNAGNLSSTLKNGHRIEYKASSNLKYTEDLSLTRKFDSIGRISEIKESSGISYAFKYDAFNRVIQKSDNNGLSFSIIRDSFGAPLEITAKSGEGVRAVRDLRGRLKEVKASNGKIRKFSYDSNGNLKLYTDAKNQTYLFTYDEANQFVRVDSINKYARRPVFGSVPYLALNR
jgi:YD repeat-containing protein